MHNSYLTMTFLGYLLASLLLCSTLNALEVQIFRDVKFKGLIYEHSAIGASPCEDLPDYAVGVAGSIITDTCLILYESPGCDGFSYKLSRDMTSQLEDLRRTVYSFHACTPEVGGDIIKVDLYDRADLLAEYNDVCGCLDIPSQVSTKLTGLHNYGNCVRVYATDSCTGNQWEDVPGGTSTLSQNLPSLGYYVRSISACGNRAQCARFDASIFKFVIHMEKPIGENSQEMALGQTTKFFNNGSATLTQEYEVVKTIRQTTKMSITKSIKEMRGYKVMKSRTVDVNVQATIPIPETTLAVDIGISVGYAATSGFGEGSGEENSETNTYEHVEEKTFVAKQSFEVPPCVEYEVSSTVKMVENYPIVYEVFSRVTGEAGGRRLTAQEISERFDDMTYVEAFDEYTAIFKATENMVANQGVETLITAEGSDIEGCIF